MSPTRGRHSHAGWRPLTHPRTSRRVPFLPVPHGQVGDVADLTLFRQCCST